VVADVDGDGLLELGVVFHNGTDNRSRLFVYDLPSPIDNEASPWPTFQGNALRNGFYNGRATGDANLDGILDRQDIEVFRRGWHRRATMPGYHPTNDFDFSRHIDGVDLSEFLNSTGSD
jgi:hypothetical protein